MKTHTHIQIVTPIAGRARSAASVRQDVLAGLADADTSFTGGRILAVIVAIQNEHGHLNLDEVETRVAAARGRGEFTLVVVEKALARRDLDGLANRCRLEHDHVAGLSDDETDLTSAVALLARHATAV